jgi:hypothetical protein
MVQQYETAIANSVLPTPNFPTLLAFQPIYAKLLRSRIDLDFTPPPPINDVFDQYNLWIAQLPCMIHTGQSQNGYPVVSFRSGAPGGSSLKLQLHQMNYLMDNLAEDPFIGYPNVAMHPCNHKLCLVCATSKSIGENHSREGCFPFVLVNDTLTCCCPHDPKCTDFPQSAGRY